MPTIEFSVERLLPCPCTALTGPWSECPECGGEGASYQELVLEIECGYSRGMRGARDHYGAPLEPDDPESCEIQSVTDASGNEVELTRREEERVEELCFEAIADARVAAAEARWESRMDR